MSMAPAELSVESRARSHKLELSVCAADQHTDVGLQLPAPKGEGAVADAKSSACQGPRQVAVSGQWRTRARCVGSLSSPRLDNYGSF